MDPTETESQRMLQFMNNLLKGLNEQSENAQKEYAIEREALETQQNIYNAAKEKRDGVAYHADIIRHVVTQLKGGL